MEIKKKIISILALIVLLVGLFGMSVSAYQSTYKPSTYIYGANTTFPIAPFSSLYYTTYMTSGKYFKTIPCADRYSLVGTDYIESVGGYNRINDSKSPQIVSTLEVTQDFSNADTVYGDTGEERLLTGYNFLPITVAFYPLADVVETNIYQNIARDGTNQDKLHIYSSFESFAVPVNTLPTDTSIQSGFYTPYLTLDIYREIGFTKETSVLSPYYQQWYTGLFVSYDFTVVTERDGIYYGRVVNQPITALEPPTIREVDIFGEKKNLFTYDLLDPLIPLYYEVYNVTEDLPAKGGYLRVNSLNITDAKISNSEEYDEFNEVNANYQEEDVNGSDAPYHGFRCIGFNQTSIRNRVIGKNLQLPSEYLLNEYRSLSGHFNKQIDILIDSQLSDDELDGVLTPVGEFFLDVGESVLALELFPGYTLGGLAITFIALSILIVVLKYFAGG